MKKKVKTAVIGVGNMGKNHVRVYSEISQLVAVADVSVHLGQAIAHQYGVPFFADFKTMLKKVKPDAVSVVVPTHAHYNVASWCLKERIPTLVEKPIANSITEAEKMLKIAKQQKTFLMVGHVERFNPAVTHLKKLIKAGKFGKIVNLLSIRVGVAPPATKGSDVVLDLAIHDIDIFNYLLDKNPCETKVIKQKIFSYNAADNASIMVRYNGTVGMIQTNWVTPIKIRKLLVTGTTCFAELDYIGQQLTMLEKVKPRPTNSFFELQAFSEVPTREIFHSKKEPLVEELKYFLAHLAKKPDFSNPKSALTALNVALS